MMRASAQGLMSLPSRERGLKYKVGEHERLEFWSLPSRERGLKFKIVENRINCVSRSLRGSVD